MSMPKRQLVAPVLFSFGMVVFGLCAHCGDLLFGAFGGAGLAAIGLAIGVVGAHKITDILALHTPTRKDLVLLPVALAAGIGLAVVFRCRTGLDLLPRQWGSFCLLAMAIGACEELTYRGFLQSYLQRYGPILACLVPAACHAAYKCSLMALPARDVHADLLILAVVTFGIGCTFGVMRQIGGNIFSAVLAHVTFDLIAYGDVSVPLWWV